MSDTPKYTPTVPLQVTFDIVAKHMLTQNKQAFLENTTTCAYRAPDGCQCAAGCLIPDDKYNPDFERCQIYPDFYCPSGPTEAVMNEGHNLHLVRKLQIIHDDHEPTNWAHRLGELAGKEYLKPDIIATTLRELDREEEIPTFVLQFCGT